MFHHYYFNRQQLKEFLDVPPNLQVEFAPHGDAAPGSKQERTVI